MTSSWPLSPGADRAPCPASPVGAPGGTPTTAGGPRLSPSTRSRGLPKPIVMMRPVADLALSPLLALAVVLAVIGVALYLARPLRRRSRRRPRRDRGALARSV